MMTGFGSRILYEPMARLHFDQEIAVFDFKRVNSEFGPGIVGGLAGLRIIRPTVPRTDHFAAFDYALTERAAEMETDVVHGRVGAIHVGDADLFVAAGKLFRFVRGGKFG